VAGWFGGGDGVAWVSARFFWSFREIVGNLVNLTLPVSIMSKKTKIVKNTNLSPFSLPKRTISNIQIGQSFAEYDEILAKGDVFIETPAIRIASTGSNSKCFFIGRRGTGKTSINIYLKTKTPKLTIQLVPQVFSPLTEYFSENARDTRQMPFKTLVTCFKRTIIDEVLRNWRQNGYLNFDRTPQTVRFERENIEKLDFDDRMINFIEQSKDILDRNDVKSWNKFISRCKNLGNELDQIRQSESWKCTVLIDRIDEHWDGSEKSVILIMALMHACIELNSQIESLNVYLFLRENIFERIKKINNEFSRLETFVISLEWSQEALLEMIEKRLNLVLNAKLQLRGPTWDAFFDEWEGKSSRYFVLNFCQHRPRDVLIYCKYAIESAQQKRHDRILVEDLQEARGKFSESRLKDLGDEYAENYPQIQFILSKFHGLSNKFTINGIKDFVKFMLVDEQIKLACSSWIYNFTIPEIFVKLMYEIGFFGIETLNGVQYRSLSAEINSFPSLTDQTIIFIHPSYEYALNLQNLLISELSNGFKLEKSDYLVVLPESINVDQYKNKLEEIRLELATLPKGTEDSSDFEKVVGEIIKLCFFESLSNIQHHERDYEGRVIRD
jgi:hypothetical protein